MNQTKIVRMRGPESCSAILEPPRENELDCCHDPAHIPLKNTAILNATHSGSSLQLFSFLILLLTAARPEEKLATAFRGSLCLLFVNYVLSCCGCRMLSGSFVYKLIFYQSAYKMMWLSPPYPCQAKGTCQCLQSTPVCLLTFGKNA